MNLRSNYLTLLLAGCVHISVLAQHPGHMVINDYQSKPVQILSPSLSTEWQVNYKPFGEVEVVQDNLGIGVKFGYLGQQYDPESGYFYNQYRYYDARQGRYLQSDPIGLEAGLSTYAYALSNPLLLKDPTGLDVSIEINRTGYTTKSISGTIFVSSTETEKSFFGNTLENRIPPNPNLPVPPGQYPAKIRADHTPNRIELIGVPEAQFVQIHNANYPSQLEGCFAVGTSALKDFVGNSVDAMNTINDIITEDGSGNILVIVKGSATGL